MIGKWRRRLLRLALGTAAGAALVLALQLALTHALPIDDLIEHWTASLGLSVEVESARARILPYPSILLTGIRSGDGIAIDRARIGLRTLALLRGGFEGARASAYGARVEVVRRADGILQVDGVRGLTAGGSTAPKRAESRPAGLPALPRIDVHDAVVRLVDHSVPSGPQTTTLHVEQILLRSHDENDTLALEGTGRLNAEDTARSLRVELDLGAASDEGRRPLSLEITTNGIDPAPIAPHLPQAWGLRSAHGSLDAQISLEWNEANDMVGQLDLRFSPGGADYAGVRLEGDVRVQARLYDEGAFRLEDARIRADSASLGAIEASGLSGRLSYTERRVTFDALEFETWGGSIDSKGTLVVGKPLAFDVELGARDLVLPGPRAAGDGPSEADPKILDLQGGFHGDWIGGEAWLEPIQGSGRVSMHGGQVPSGDLLESLVKSLPTLFPEHHDVSWQVPFDTTPLEHLTATITVAAGWVDTDDLTITTQDYGIEANGWLDARLDYAFEGGLAFTARGFSRLLEAASVRGRHDPRTRMPAVPFSITGNLADSDTRVHLDDQLLTTLVILPGAVHQVSESASDALDAGGRALDTVGETGSRGLDATREAGAEAIEDTGDWIGNLVDGEADETSD